MKKKILFLALILTLTFGVSACSNSNNKLGTENNANTINNEVAASSSLAAPLKQALVNNDEVAQVPVVQKTTNMPTPDKQKDLIKKYSKAILKTNFGNITLKFYSQGAPLAVNNFLNLAQAGFYNKTKFHRVIKSFMIQGGDPLTTGSDVYKYGTGGPGYQFKNEDSGHKLVAGSLAMANAGPDTNGSQFFILTAPTAPWLDGSYTNFGEVISGMDIVRKIEDVAVKANPGNPQEVSFPTQDIIINSIELLK